MHKTKVTGIVEWYNLGCQEKLKSGAKSENLAPELRNCGTF